MATSTQLPPDLRALAQAHRVRQQQLAMAATQQTARLWGLLDQNDPAGSWSSIAPRILQLIVAALLEASRGSQDYVSAAVRMWGADPDPAGQVAEWTFAQTASDGRPLDTLLEQPALEAQAFVDQGMDQRQAKTIGQRHLDRIVATQVADAARVPTGVAQVNDRSIRGWIRMLTPPSCSRCVVLAGKFYAVNAGFDRHPFDDCVHIPAAEHIPDLATDPKAYFDSLDEPEQDRVFTIAGAKAIRDGADIGQVVNARRGATGIGYAAGRLTAEERTMLRGGRQRGRLDTIRVNGRDVFATTEASTTRGVAGVRLGAKETGKKTAGSRYRRAQIPRLMPEQLYLEAERLGWSRDEIVRQLKRFGYIL
ncbi:MAG: hypothetical protein JWO67_2569 [Streptosporangiaceae bacterium]|nr:hypothetical protein [Streptosporangiaceae bacterium]